MTSTLIQSFIGRFGALHPLAIAAPRPAAVKTANKGIRNAGKTPSTFVGTGKIRGERIRLRPPASRTASRAPFRGDVMAVITVTPRFGIVRFAAYTIFLKVIFFFLFIPRPRFVFVLITPMTAKATAFSRILASLDLTRCQACLARPLSAACCRIVPMFCVDFIVFHARFIKWIDGLIPTRGTFLQSCTGSTVAISRDI